MASTIDSATNAVNLRQVLPQQPPVTGRKDSDGDTDGSKAGEVEKPKPTATLGNNIDVKA